MEEKRITINLPIDVSVYLCFWQVPEHGVSGTTKSKDQDKKVKISIRLNQIQNKNNPPSNLQDFSLNSEPFIHF